MVIEKIKTDQLGFGKVFTDHMFIMYFNDAKGWHSANIKKYEPFNLNPATCVLHYAQTVFEGLKGYKALDGRILLFRPDQNAKRINKSAYRLCMPEVPEDVFLNAVKELVLLEKEWIPSTPESSLYIRPTLLGTDSFLGVHPSKEYIFYIILSPVGSYYKEGFKPISIYVEDTMVRASAGGVGEIKTGANYAASLYAAKKAEEKGFSQVLWLDSNEHKYVEEVGSMNVFFVYGKKLVTPPLTGSILPGITRASVLSMAKDRGLEVAEESLTIDQILDEIKSGKITEVFGTGTAAVLSPVGSLYYRGKNYEINHNKVGEVTQLIYDQLVGIQYGTIKDNYGWSVELS